MPGSAPEILLSGNCSYATLIDQCNCACPVIQKNDCIAEVSDPKTIFVQPVIYEQVMDQQGYRLLYNLTGGREVAVLNPAAYRLWTQFRNPMSLSMLPVTDLPHAQKLLRAGLLEPAYAAIEPCQAEPEELNVWLHVTNACNLRCSYCYVHKSPEHMSEATGRAAVDAALRSAQAHGIRQVSLKYAGGEPLLKLDLVYRLHEYAQQAAAQARVRLDGVVLSNGTLLDEAAVDGLRSRGLRLMLSVDGLEAAHDSQRAYRNGHGSSQQVWQAVERSVCSGLTPFISVTVTERSAGDLPELVERLIKMELPFNLNFARAGEGEPVEDTEAMIAGLLETLRRMESNLPGFSLTGSLLDRAFFSHPHERPCGMGGSYLVFDQAGCVPRCQMTLGEHLTDVQAEDPLGEVRQQVRWSNPSVEQKEGCRKCQWRYVCAGGCPLAAYRASGRYDAPSPYCAVYQTLFPEILRLEGLRILQYNHVRN